MKEYGITATSTDSILHHKQFYPTVNYEYLFLNLLPFVRLEQQEGVIQGLSLYLRLLLRFIPQIGSKITLESFRSYIRLL